MRICFVVDSLVYLRLSAEINSFLVQVKPDTDLPIEFFLLETFIFLKSSGLQLEKEVVLKAIHILS